MLFLLIFTCSSLSVCAFKVNGIYYKITSETNKTAEVIAPSLDVDGPVYLFDYSGDVVIPSTIVYQGKTYIVASIGYRAFYDCSGLLSVTIPATITSIGNEAFGGDTFCDDSFSTPHIYNYSAVPQSMNLNAFNFDYCKNVVFLHVLRGYKTTYGTAPVWLNFRKVYDDLYILGDVNYDGFVNITDIVELNQNLLNGTESRLDKKVADINKDGIINITDVVELIAKILK